MTRRTATFLMGALLIAACIFQRPGKSYRNHLCAVTDDRMRALFRDYIAQKVYDDIRGPSNDES